MSQPCVEEPKQHDHGEMRQIQQTALWMLKSTFRQRNVLKCNNYTVNTIEKSSQGYRNANINQNINDCIVVLDRTYHDLTSYLQDEQHKYCLQGK